MQQREVALTAAYSHLLQVHEQMIHQVLDTVNMVLQHASHFVQELQVLTSRHEMEVG